MARDIPDQAPQQQGRQPACHTLPSICWSAAPLSASSPGRYTSRCRSRSRRSTGACFSSDGTMASATLLAAFPTVLPSFLTRSLHSGCRQRAGWNCCPTWRPLFALCFCEPQCATQHAGLAGLAFCDTTRKRRKRAAARAAAACRQPLPPALVFHSLGNLARFRCYLRPARLIVPTAGQAAQLLEAASPAAGGERCRLVTDAAQRLLSETCRAIRAHGGLGPPGWQAGRGHGSSKALGQNRSVHCFSSWLIK